MIVSPVIKNMKVDSFIKVSLFKFKKKITGNLLNTLFPPNSMDQNRGSSPPLIDRLVVRPHSQLNHINYIRLMIMDQMLRQR